MWLLNSDLQQVQAFLNAVAFLIVGFIMYHVMEPPESTLNLMLGMTATARKAMQSFTPGFLSQLKDTRYYLTLVPLFA